MTKYFNTQGTQTFVNKLKFGNSALKTNAKTLVGAINELKIMIDNLPQSMPDNLVLKQASINGLSSNNAKLCGNAIIYGNDIYTKVYASGYYIIKSPDGGKTWTVICDSNSANTFSIDSIGDTLYICDRTIRKSTDGGVTWEVVYVNGRGIHATNIKKYDNIVFLDDNDRSDSNSNNDVILYSTDNGDTWNTIPMVLGNITKNNNIFCATRKSPYSSVKTGVYYSTDGIAWQKSTGINDNNHSVSLISPIYKIGSVLIVACQGNSTDCNGIFYSIDDGITWQSTNISDGSSNLKLLSSNVAMFNNKFISTDGISWSEFYYINGLTSNGNLIGIDESKNICVSIDTGNTWVHTAIKVSNYPTGVSIDGNRIVNDLCSHYSTDGGNSWNELHLPDLTDSTYTEQSILTDPRLDSGIIYLCIMIRDVSDNTGNTYKIFTIVSNDFVTWKVCEGNIGEHTVFYNNSIIGSNDQYPIVYIHL